MRTEIEIKARLQKPEVIEGMVKERGEFVREFEKRDTYFRCRRGDGRETDIRIRVDDDKKTCTFKDRKTITGVEKNQEQEFEISDARSMALLLIRLGGHEILRKVKEGREYRLNSLTVEISEIEGLGFFIEVEKLLKDPAPDEYEGTEREIAELLQDLGIRRDDWEERTYMEMFGIDRAAGDYGDDTES